MTFHLAVPDGDSRQARAAVRVLGSAGTPSEDVGLAPLPATGPYVITEATGERIQLERISPSVNGPRPRSRMGSRMRSRSPSVRTTARSTAWHRATLM